jgi:ABC-type Mn2+/Zn2+ transport system permease subunit
MTKLAEYWKFLVAALAPVFLAVQAAVTEDGISQQEAIGIVFAAVVAVGVLLKGNRPPVA